MINILKTSKYERERNKFAKGNSEAADALIKTLEKFSSVQGSGRSGLIKAIEYFLSGSIRKSLFLLI